MSETNPLAFANEPSNLPTEPRAKHEALVDQFGQFVFWLRNWALLASKKRIESNEAREALGTMRRRYYEGVAELSQEQRDAAMLFAEDTLNVLLERFIWVLGDEGTDARFGERHAYRLRLEMEIVDIETGKVVAEETINRGGDFFGSYWRKWLSRYGYGKNNGSS